MRKGNHNSQIMSKSNDFSQKVTVFRDKLLPEQQMQLAGYAALINTYQLQVPLPYRLTAISHKHKTYQQLDWLILTSRHAPENTLYGHLTFALKYEGVDLLILKTLFDTIDSHEIKQIVLLEPTGIYSRRIWFLYEWLQDIQIDLPDSPKMNYVDVLDAKLQYPGLSRPSKRHHVRNNLPGVRGFCPIVRRTENLEHLLAMQLAKTAKIQIGEIHPDILIRAASYLLLKDSKASFAIEGENPPQNRAERWGKAIAQAGLNPLSKEELYRLQHIVISDFRFIHPGYRDQGGFIGEHDRSTGQPLPDHISARWQDIPDLMNSLIEVIELLKNSDFDAVITAAIIAFGFVFIHPFEDGNGRIHRYLFHHILAEKNFTPKGFIFPISAVILEHIDRYRKILEAYSQPRLEFIEWRATETGNIEVLNETINLYRYFDATPQAEFLFECIKETIEKTLPVEVEYLKKFDEMKSFIVDYIDMPDRLIYLLINFLNRGNGKLSKRALDREFKLLKSSEIKIIEEKYAEIFL